MINEPPSCKLKRASIQDNKTFITVINTLLGPNNTGIAQATYYVFDVIHLKEPKLKWFMFHLKWSVSTSKLMRSIINGSVIAVSDGSYYPRYNVGACAWVITLSDGDEWIEGGGMVFLKNKTVIAVN